MPEANVLYSVTAAVVLGLVTWVAVVLKTAKEPWARDLPPAANAGDDAPQNAIFAEAPAEDVTSSAGAPGSEKAKAVTKAQEDAVVDVKAEERSDAKS